MTAVLDLINECSGKEQKLFRYQSKFLLVDYGDTNSDDFAIGIAE